MSEGGNSDDVPVNLETGLLSVVRKIINLLPDSHVKRVIGPILDQESIVVMANNPSILIRTAVVRVRLLPSFPDRKIGGQNSWLGSNQTNHQID